jgi:hypothetical protein
MVCAVGMVLLGCYYGVTLVLQGWLEFNDGVYRHEEDGAVRPHLGQRLTYIYIYIYICVCVCVCMCVCVCVCVHPYIVREE